MADQRNGGIAWTDETWNPVRGCTRVSAGCMNCYAESMAARFCGAGQPYEGTINPETKRWNGNIKLVPEHLQDPLRWKRPRMVFVNSMSDLFHESVPDEFIDQVFAVMALAKQHTFQVLTKRTERMLDYLRLSAVRDKWVRAGDAFAESMEPQRYANLSHIGDPGNKVSVFTQFPLPNVWLGISVENQEAADARIPLLLQTPAAVHWISVEPMLGAVSCTVPFDGNRVDMLQREFPGHPRIDWVVCGGESGPNARPIHPDWARSLRDQCAEAGVPFLFKQWGEWAPHQARAGGDEGGDLRRGHVRYLQGDGREPDGHFRKGDAAVARIGKKAAGRLLDGVLHDGYPERIA